MATPGTLTTEQRQREDDLVRRHLPLVGYAVAEMVNKVPRHVSRADLESAGMEGLAQAARSYDLARGIAFDRYASNRIRGALLEELRRRDWASRSVRSRARKVTAASDELTARLGHLVVGGPPTWTPGSSVRSTTTCSAPRSSTSRR